MRNSFLPLLCCVLFWCEQAQSQIENEVKRGVFPFMAILYYPDETVVDSTGTRFQRGAVLIKPEWLLSAAIDHSVLDGIPLGFPRKTLLARMGAMTLDANFTFNEDEDEQEREIIQIVKPSIHNKDAFWFTDITLLQTLVPFKLSSAIAPTNIYPKRDYDDKNCAILVYAKKIGNGTEDKALMQLNVELLPPSVENCGTQFSSTTMTCAVPGGETKSAFYESDFCQGNSGGPLMCEGEVMALQTYIENNCKPPHLYQLLASWDTMITCGIDQKCGVDASCNNCVAINKDMPLNETVATTITTINVTTIIQNDTETTGPPANVTEKSISEESDSLTPGITTSSGTTTIESETVPADPDRFSPHRTEPPPNETSSAEPESERRINYMDLLGDESSDIIIDSSGSSSNESTSVQTADSEPKSTEMPPSRSTKASSWPKVVSEFPTMEDDVTQSTRMEMLHKPRYGGPKRLAYYRPMTNGNIITIPDWLTLVILACFI